MAAEIGRAFGAEMVVLHGREDELTWAIDVVLETEVEASDLVDGIVRQLKDAGGSARGVVVRAPVARTAQTILDAAEDEGAGLIVMGTRGSLGLGPAAHGEQSLTTSSTSPNSRC